MPSERYECEGALHSSVWPALPLFRTRHHPQPGGYLHSEHRSVPMHMNPMDLANTQPEKHQMIFPEQQVHSIQKTRRFAYYHTSIFPDEHQLTIHSFPPKIGRAS